MAFKEERVNGGSLKALPQFDRFCDDTEPWVLFKNRFINFIELNEYPVEKRARGLLAHLSTSAFSKLRDELYPGEPVEKSFEELIAVLDGIYSQGVSKWIKRIEFRDIKQEQSESLQDFARRLRRSAEPCEWSIDTLSYSLVEQFLRGIKDHHVKDHALHKADSFKTLNDAIKEAESVATRKERLDINYGGYKRQGRPKASSSAQRCPSGSCFRCGKPNHIAPECPYKQSVCRKCGGIGHLQAVCRKSNATGKMTQQDGRRLPEHSSASVSSGFHGNRRAGGQSRRDADSSSSDGHSSNAKQSGTASKAQRVFVVASSPHSHVSVRAIRTKRVEVEPIRVTLDIEGAKATMEVDSGCGVTIMPYARFVAVLPNFEHHTPDVTLCLANGEEVVPHSFVEVKVTWRQDTKLLRLYLVKERNFPMLLGRDWIQVFHMNSIYVCNISECTAKDLLADFPKLTSAEVGAVPHLHSLTVQFKSQPKPVFFKTRKVPYALADAVNRELRSMQDKGWISQVQHSEWAHPIVPIMKKDGSVRVCVDLKVGLNQQVKLMEYKMPIVQEILDNLGTAKVFSTIDIANAFMHVPIHQDHRKYFTINTPLGLFELTRMPFGYVNAPLCWQRIIDSIVGGIQGVHVFYDDILVATETKQEHETRLREVLQRLNANDLRINIAKCKFMQNSVSYCGFVLTAAGIRKSESKVQAITKMPVPKNVSELKSFLGLVQFYGQFVQDLANTAAPLYSLLKKGAMFQWTEACQKSFQSIKRMLASEVVLMPFNPNLPLVLSTDASPVGVSAILAHRLPSGVEKPIAYYSQVLNETERRYTQLDREALAIKKGVSKFQQYLFGRRFICVTDSRPLLSIFSPSTKLPPLTATRLQHYAIFLQSFKYDIEYRSTLRNTNADALSRLPCKSEDLPGTENRLPDEVGMFFCRLREGAPINASVIERATNDDEELQQIIKALRTKTESKLAGVSSSEFTISGNSLFRGHRIVIPEKLRGEILSELHQGHFGVVKMKALARQFCWWPSIDKDIEGVARRCHICMLTANNPVRAAVHAWEPATGPWQRIHVDYAGPINGSWYLVVVDAYSKWLEVCCVKSCTSKVTATKLEELFARFGYPCQLVSDNATTFCSREFEFFLRERGIEHRRSAPFHPATNGQAERYVQTLKKGLLKVGSPENQPLKFSAYLLRLRNQPSEATGQSPAELFLGRPLRDKLSQLTEASVQPSVSNPDGVKFSAGERVSVRIYNKQKKWVTGIVTRTLGKRHVVVRLDNGIHLKRHINQVRRTAVDTPGGGYDLFSHFQLADQTGSSPPEETAGPLAEITEDGAETFDSCRSGESARLGAPTLNLSDEEELRDIEQPSTSTPRQQDARIVTNEEGATSQSPQQQSPTVRRSRRKKRRVNYREFASSGRTE